jgi:hypothetical protein
MDSEGDPFESSEEKAYNKAIGELARKKLECDSQLEELHQEVVRLAANQSASGPVSSGGDPLLVSGNSSFPEKTSANWNHTTVVPGNSVGREEVQECPPVQDCPPVRECPTVRECPPTRDCPPERDCPPTRDCERNFEGVNSGRPLPPSDEGSGSGLVALPESFLVGAVVTLLILAVAVLIGVAIRYIPVILSGIVVLSMVCIVWYYSSRYPEASRRLGSRVWGALSGAAGYLVDRLLGRRNSEVSGKAVKVDNLCRGVIV